jgi:hypothetical protein
VTIKANNRADTCGNFLVPALLVHVDQEIVRWHSDLPASDTSRTFSASIGKLTDIKKETMLAAKLGDLEQRLFPHHSWRAGA